jgi:FdhD protein
MTGEDTFAETAPFIWRGNSFQRGERSVPEETPVALTYDGSTHAVMMATPQDLEDFAIGFSLTEEIIESINDIDSLDIVSLADGVEARLWLKPYASKRHGKRRRQTLGPTGCGLCGVESLAEAVKPARHVHSQLFITPGNLFSAMASLQPTQTLNARTRAVHAAALFDRHGLGEVREDVGRHNALDKLVGAAAKAGIGGGGKAVLLTSRVSVELIQKTARLGAPIVAAFSAPTALALRVAEGAGITVAAILRDDGFEVFTHPERICQEASVHGA